MKNLINEIAVDITELLLLIDQLELDGRTICIMYNYYANLDKQEDLEARSCVCNMLQAIEYIIATNTELEFDEYDMDEIICEIKEHDYLDTTDMVEDDLEKLLDRCARILKRDAAPEEAEEDTIEYSNNEVKAIIKNDEEYIRLLIRRLIDKANKDIYLAYYFYLDKENGEILFFENEVKNNDYELLFYIDNDDFDETTTTDKVMYDILNRFNYDIKSKVDTYIKKYNKLFKMAIKTREERQQFATLKDDFEDFYYRTNLAGLTMRLTEQKMEELFFCISNGEPYNN